MVEVKRAMSLAMGMDDTHDARVYVTRVEAVVCGGSALVGIGGVEAGAQCGC